MERLRRRSRPTLSIVVPVYNVESYLDDCLQSILAQPFQDFEIVLVDDGSPDGSGAIAQRYARDHKRIRLLRQENAGLGAARNAGVRLCRGEFLAFVDSDDALPPDAYTAMMDTILRSGSDFVIGALARNVDGREFVAPRMRENHRLHRTNITVEEMPEILADVFAVNKVFRRSFWDRADMSFPEGVRYEDQLALTKAYFAASSLDVIRDTVYVWRIREDKSSITQQRHELADLVDRVHTKRASTDIVLRDGSEATQHEWFAGVMPMDMHEYFRSVPGCSDEYWTLLRDSVREFWSASTVPFEESHVPVQVRVMGWLVGQDRRSELEQLVRFLDEHEDGLPLVVGQDEVVCPLPGYDNPSAGIPSPLFVVADHEKRWQARLIRAEWGDSIYLSGFALMRSVPTADADTSLSVTVVHPSGAAVELVAQPRREPKATAFVDRRGQDYDDCGFAVTIDAEALLAVQPLQDSEVSRWRFHLHRVVNKMEGSGRFTQWGPEATSQAWIEVRPGVEGRIVVREQEPVLELKRSG